MGSVVSQAGLHAEPKTWCVTGAAGFIGSHLTEALLKEGQRVIGLDNLATGYRANLDDVRQRVGEGAWQRFSFVEGDIRHFDTCRRITEAADLVLHQAALGSVPRSIADPLATHSANVDGFLNMLTAARDAGIRRFVYASSSSVYGDHPGLPKVEDTIGTPLSPYAVSKRIDELYARTFADHYGMETVGLRYFNVFGPRQDPNGAYAAVIPKWIGQLLDGETPTINGDGETSRDFCFVLNVVQANLRAALAPNEATGTVYNVAVGDRTTLRELYELIASELEGLRPGWQAPRPALGPFRAGDVRHSLADVSRAQDAFGYEPLCGIREGMVTTTKWFARELVEKET
ncbi:MAG: SDR family oxidoreductase [Bacteroidota bacterium]